MKFKSLTETREFLDEKLSSLKLKRQELIELARDNSWSYKEKFRNNGTGEGVIIDATVMTTPYEVIDDGNTYHWEFLKFDVCYFAPDIARYPFDATAYHTQWKESIIMPNRFKLNIFAVVKTDISQYHEHHCFEPLATGVVLFGTDNFCLKKEVPL